MILEDSNENVLIANLILDYGISANLILDYGISADPRYGAVGGPLKVQFFATLPYQIMRCSSAERFVGRKAINHLA